MSIAWSNEETFRFIALYQNEPAIWNPKHRDHKDRNKVIDAWNRIASATNIPVTELKKKKETLMTAFRTHYKKKIASMKCGIPSEMYTPIWIYYDALEIFLKDIYECSSIINGKDNFDQHPEQNLENGGFNDQFKTEKYEMKPTINSPARKRYCTNLPELQEASKQVNQVFTRLNNVLNEKRDEDECDLYGKLLAKKLRQFTERDRLEIMYEIDGFLLTRRNFCNRSSSPLRISNRLSPTYLLPSSPLSSPSLSAASSLVFKNTTDTHQYTNLTSE